MTKYDIIVHTKELHHTYRGSNIPREDDGKLIVPHEDGTAVYAAGEWSRYSFQKKQIM